MHLAPFLLPFPPPPLSFPPSLEEGIVELLVVDGELAHLWTDPLSCLLLQTLSLLLLLQSLSHLHDPCGLGEGGGREGGGEGGKSERGKVRREGEGGREREGGRKSTSNT